MPLEQVIQENTDTMKRLIAAIEAMTASAKSADTITKTVVETATVAAKYQEQKAIKAEPPVKADPAPATEAITYEVVSDLAKKILADKGIASVQPLLAKAGIKKISELDQAGLVAFHAELQGVA